MADLIEFGSAVYMEFWVSLASLLRSYTAAHGLNGNLQALVELGEETILVRHGSDWLELRRTGRHVAWHRSGGASGVLEFTEAGRLRSDTGEEEMDMMAEAWARELMQ